MILYLDYDGVLHADDVYRTRKGIVLKSAGRLLEHAGILVAALEPHPEIKIVLSTSWVRELGFARAKSYLPPALQERVIGATYHSLFEKEDDVFQLESTKIPWSSLTRYQQILQHVMRHGIADWIAIDNDNDGWPGTMDHHLVLTDDTTGLGEADAQDRLFNLLEKRLFSQKNDLT